MASLSDRALDHLRHVVDAPDFSGTKYEVLDCIGRGGMGSVYRAHDRDLGREVAIKVVHDADDAPDLAPRLEREARTLARLEHPGIVPVHDVGVLPDGRTYYVMKLVRGERLDHWARAARSVAERIRVIVRLSEAIAFAHANGVIHRDLTPANVMIGAFGEVLVLDWGVAKHLQSSPTDARADDAHAAPNPTDATGHGMVLGTPGFMAPEQARGDSALVDARADVFAIGAILARLFATDATPPLEAIVARATAVEPSARYERVELLATDLEAYLDGERVSAFREGIAAHVRRLAIRHRTPLLLIVAYLLMRIVLLAFR